MKAIKVVTFLAVILFTHTAFSQQKGVKVRFQPVFQGEILELGKPYGKEKDIRIETFRFYISNAALYHNQDKSGSSQRQYALLDLDQPESLSLEFALPKEGQNPNNLRFNLGIDSLTNVAGAMGGDLDPTKGMYWTWQSGYINFKLEGTSPECTARKNRFQYHIGGYTAPSNTLQRVEMDIIPKEEIVIQIEIGQLLAQMDLAATPAIMSPNTKAMEMADLLPSIFQLKF